MLLYEGISLKQFINLKDQYITLNYINIPGFSSKRIEQLIQFKGKILELFNKYKMVDDIF